MRILITGGGTVTAQSLVKALRLDTRDHYIAIGDMDPTNATKAFVDDFVRLPSARASEFAESCLSAVQRLDIDLLVPLIVELEFLPLIAIRGAFEAAGCRIAAPSADVVTRIADKLFFARFLEERGIPTPKTRPYSADITVEALPVYLKPRRASGSVGADLVTSATMLHELAGGRADLIVQDFAPGPEFTVDCFADANGVVVAAVARERILVKSGVSVKARVADERLVENTAAAVVEASGISGPANVQGKFRDGVFTIIEMNPRFSGTLALTTAAGINFGSLLVDLYEGKPIASCLRRQEYGLTMMRYWEEVYEDADGALFVNGSLAVDDPDLGRLQRRDVTRADR